MEASIHDGTPFETTRERTAEGFLRGRAIVTRVGVLEYDGRELGLERNGKVRVKQTAESVFHPQTMRSLENVAVTLGHPSSGMTPSTFKGAAVGSVSSPVRHGDLLETSILLGDRDAIERVNDGQWTELSIGKTFTLEPCADGSADYQTSGPILANHVALVPRGRAGPDVRVLDTKTTGDDMSLSTEDITQLKEALNAAVSDAMPEKSDAQSARQVADAILPKLDDLVKKVGDAEEARRQEEAAEVAEQLKTRHAADVQDAEQRGYERGASEGRMRFEALSSIHDAGLQARLENAPIEEVLAASVADIAPWAAEEKMGQAELWALLRAKRHAATVAPRPAPGQSPSPFTSDAFRAKSPSTNSARNIKDYEDMVNRAFQQGKIVRFNKGGQ